MCTELDDTTLLLHDKTQISVAIETVAEFLKASGLSMNIDKCKFLAIKECSDFAL